MRIKTEIPLTIGFIKRALKIKENPQDFAKFIRAICTDSRKIKSGDLFIGLHGENHDGSDFIKDIKGAAILSIGALGSDADIPLSDPNASLLLIANKYKKLLPTKKTVAITGSVGKTSTKNLLSELLEKRFVTHATYKNLNNEFGIPFTVLSAPKKTEALIIEAGMNHEGELKKASLCIEPDISVITKIGSAHIGNLGSLEKIRDAKCEILCGMKKEFALIPYGERLLTQKIKNYLTVSSVDERADYFFSETDEDEIYRFKAQNETHYFKIPLLNSANFHVKDSLAFALSVSSIMNMTQSDLQKALLCIDFSKYSNTSKIGSLTVINDSYNSSPDAVISALDALKQKNGRKSAVLGDMLELGDFSENLHYEIGLHASGANLEYLYLVGKYANSIFEGAVRGGFDKNKIFINESCEEPEITALHILNHSTDEVILFKASRKIKLERIINILKKALK